MSYYPGLNPLRDVLAELYPAASIARVVAAEAGIAEKLIDFNGASVEFWKSILTVAHNNGQVQALIDVARSHFPQNKKLVEAEQVFHETPVPDVGQPDEGKPNHGNIAVTVKGNSGIIAGNNVKNSKLQNIGDITGNNNQVSQ